MIPDKFINYVFRERVKFLKSMKEEFNKSDFLINFTRTSPVVVTYGPAGLSGSVKMLGVVPKEEYINEILEEMENISRNSREVLSFLLKKVYVEERIDFSKLGGLEMGFGHSWTNIKSTGEATLVFFTPPTESYEVRCNVEILEEGPYYEYLNRMHRIYHSPGDDRKYPAYIFKIREIYDNSATREGFGRLIYP